MNKTWFKLDAGGTLFPAIMTNKWGSLFRLSFTLKEEIDPKVLQEAVNQLESRFPSMYVALHHGLFWNYLEKTKKPIEVRMDYAYPLIYMSAKQLRKACLRVLYFKNRIAVEFFHCITDGRGARTYLCSLVAHYLKLKHNVVFEYGDYVLNPQEHYKEDEIEDSYLKHESHGRISSKEERAYHIRGQKVDDEFNVLTSAFIPTDKLIEKAHEYNCKLTPFICAVMAQSIMEIQDEEKARWQQKPVKITVPFDLRAMLDSKSLRNFALTFNLEVDPRQGEYTLEELCERFKHQMALYSTRQYMKARIATNNCYYNMPIVKYMPLFMKYLVISLVYHDTIGELFSTIHISNLMAYELPEEISKYIEYSEFITGVQRSNCNNCSISTINNVTNISMIRTIEESKVEQKFFSKLVELGIPVEIDCNRREG